jgi:hypothetical protein
MDGEGSRFPIRLAGAWEWTSRRQHGLGDDPLEHIEGDTQMNENRSWAWWLFLPVLVLGYLVVVIAKASMVSIFDEDE